MTISEEIIVATINGNTTTYDWQDFFSATWNPTVKAEFVVLGRLHGKTYNEKREQLRDKAIDFQRIDEGGLTYGEYALICNYFEKYGRRYGLLREFHENGIC